MTNTSCVPPTLAEYSFLGRLRYSEANCTALGGQYYRAEGNKHEDCVFNFGNLWEQGACPSWEVGGMGHQALNLQVTVTVWQ